MTGKTAKSKEQRAKSMKRHSGLAFALSPSHFAPKGFTLLELMIVISIIIILVSVALPQYQKTIMHARETMLRFDLDHHAQAYRRVCRRQGQAAAVA